MLFLLRGMESIFIYSPRNSRWIECASFSHSIKFTTKCFQLLRAVTNWFVVSPLGKADDLILMPHPKFYSLSLDSLYSVTGKHRNTKFQPQDTDNSSRPFLRQSFWEDPFGRTCECFSIYFTFCYRLLTSETFLLSSGEHDLSSVMVVSILTVWQTQKTRF